MNHDQEIFEDEQKLYLGDFKLWGRLFKVIIPQWKWVLTAVSLAFIITGASLMWPRLVQVAMDRYILNNSLSAEVTDERGDLDRLNFPGGYHRRVCGEFFSGYRSGMDGPKDHALSAAGACSAM